METENKDIVYSDILREEAAGCGNVFVRMEET